MPQIVADLNLCEGYGNCVAAAEEFFELDDEGMVVLRRVEFDEGDRTRVTEAVRSCPAAALRVDS